MTEIELKNVTYTYGEGTPFKKTALNDVSLKISGGIITGLIGHTGSGKSTLVQLLNGLNKPTEGKVFVGGEDIWAEPKNIAKYRFKVGLVFQYPEYQLFEETVRADISYGPKNMGLSAEEIKKRVDEAVLFCGIEQELLEKSPFDLSGGQKRRVAIAGIMAMKPEVLVLDEPAAGLDPKGREDILGGIRSYQRASKSTVIIVSHSMEDMAKYSDEIVVMSKGKVFMKGTVAEIFAKSDELSSVGLEAPQITLLCKELNRRGLDLPPVYTVEMARNEILKLLRKGNS